jgi:hypothetical protein
MEEATGGTVDALLLGCVGGETLIWHHLTTMCIYIIPTPLARIIL